MKTSQIIDDEDESKLRASYFNLSRRTIFVVHGFTGRCELVILKQTEFPIQ